MTIKIRRDWKIDGVLTDATSVKLRDSGNTYGIKRNDTDAVVVAAGTDVPKLSTGIYEYELTEPAAGLTYTAWFEIIYNGATYRFEEDIVGLSSSSADILAEAGELIGGAYEFTDSSVYVKQAERSLQQAAVCSAELLASPLYETLKPLLIAHFYTLSNPSVTSKSINGASKSFSIASPGKGLNATLWGQQALALDTTGCLASTFGTKIQFAWGGTAE